MLNVTDLRCEYAENPLGMDEPRPRFSWMLQANRRATVQTAYRVKVASDAKLLARGKADLWDSGTVTSADTCGVEYAGKPLASRQRCYWTVEVRDNHRGRAEAGAAWFEMGLLAPEDWRAQWVTYPSCWTGGAGLIRGLLELDKPVARARAYVAGLGYCEFLVNGSKLGDAVLDPAPTDYSRRVLYSTYDITGLLKRGPNVIGAVLGTGWYGTPKFIAQVEVTHTDGSTTRLLTGGKEGFCRWMMTTGPIVLNNVFDGEDYDARLEEGIEGWDKSWKLGWDVERTRRWMMAMNTEAPGGRMKAAMCEPIRVVKTLKPASIRKLGDGKYVVDFGQNMAGWVRIRVRGPRGRRVSLLFAESLYADGTANQENLRKARAQDNYTVRGGRLEQWEPRFTYHGFRYVQVEGWPGVLKAGDISARVVRSAVEQRGQFECSDALLNRIQRNVLWTEASNLHGIPTDCPQRDERQGWLNDVTARGEEAVYNFDMVRLFTKWLDDIADSQGPDGSVPDTVPYRWGNRPADPVCIGYVLLPWLLWQHYGDRRLLERHYEGMKRLLACYTANSKGGIMQYSYYGDWSPPTKLGDQLGHGDSAVNFGTPGVLVSTGMYYYLATLVGEVAHALGKKDDCRRLDMLAREIHEAFNDEFWNEEAGSYGRGRQSGNCMALYMGLVPAERRQQVVEALVKEVHANDDHLTTGNICTKYLFEALAEAGHAELAFKVATQRTYPSWGYMIDNGATTIWERWELATGGAMNSHNHPMMGSISAWFYRTLAGLRADETAPGMRRFIVRPSFVTGLKHAAAELATPHGQAAVAWRRVEGGIEVHVEVPVNCQAVVRLPADAREVRMDGKPTKMAKEGIVIGSGEYSFTFEISTLDGDNRE